MVKATVKEFRKLRENRLKQVAALVAGLAGRQVRLSSAPESPVTWPQGAEKLDVVVTVMDDGLTDALAEIRYLALRLTALEPTVTITDRWTFLDKTFTTQGPATSEHVFTFDKPETHFVQVLRTVKLDVKVPPRHACPATVAASVSRKAEMKAGRIKIEVKDAQFPTEIAGRWTGTLTITTLNYAKEGGQGCELIDSLKGKPMGMTATLTPSNFMAGRMDLAVSPPKGMPAQAGPPAALNYRNDNGAFSAAGAMGEGTMTLKGSFRNSPAGWQLVGAWQWAGKGATAAGTWSGANPNAR
jgi:hypothetical protein